MKFNSDSDGSVAGSNIPEKRLLAAVLQRAITDYIAGEGDLREQARIWLFDDELTDAPLSFPFICEALDFEVPGIREAIQFQADSGGSLMAEAASAVI